MENPRSRSRSPRPWNVLEPSLHFRFVQPKDASLYQFLPAALLGSQVRWLVQQKPEWKGWYRDAYHFGALLEEMYAKNVEIADAELLVRDANGQVNDVHGYRHQMKKGDDVMTQTRYTNEERTVIMCEGIQVPATPRRRKSRSSRAERPHNTSSRCSALT